MQCKDIPDKPILEFLSTQEEWCNLLQMMFVFNKGIPEKLLLAKLNNLIKRGFIHGCTCGCRGDFYITEKGREFLKALNDDTSTK